MTKTDMYIKQKVNVVDPHLFDDLYYNLTGEHQPPREEKNVKVEYNRHLARPERQSDYPAIDAMKNAKKRKN